ncbi:uncharacterized protein LOC141718878 [Apium graveolens]|uniref:uncharacterized protein LOC141718878 n=1 Tax=Apium graveolens TaxID=4045 RepID=UPI003D7BDD3D
MIDHIEVGHIAALEPDHFLQERIGQIDRVASRDLETMVHEGDYSYADYKYAVRLAEAILVALLEEKFQAVKPPEFEGSTDPTKARTWLKEIEKAFALVKDGEDQKTEFASYFLKGEANYWWESKKALEGTEIVTWERFTEFFLEKYFMRYIKNQMELKFLELKQRNLSVAEYEAKFTELSRFVPEQVDPEEKREKRFQQGLKSWIRSGVAIFKLTMYIAVVQKAMIIEGESEMSHKGRGQDNFQNWFNKKPGFQAKTNIYFRRSYQGNRGPGNRFQITNQQRKKGNYSNECPIRKADITYFHYGRKGHIAKNCKGLVAAANVPRIMAPLPPSPPPQQN